MSEATRGSLLGAACGDAVGAPFEGARTVPRAAVEQWLSSSEPMGWTDDTAMTLVLARHLVATGGAVDTDRLARDFARAWQDEPYRGYGALPPQIFRAVLAGDDWADVAGGAFGGTGSLGNGGAMRAAPVALLDRPLDERVHLARQQAAVTHTHPLAQDGAALQCAAVAEAARTAGEPIHAPAFIAAVSAHVTTPDFRQALTDALDLVQRHVPPKGIATRLGSDITALGSVPVSVALFLSNPDEIGEAMASAVEIGGDTDTVASMVGAIAGARVGEAGLPNGLVDRLEASADIRALADQLARSPVDRTETST